MGALEHDRTSSKGPTVYAHRVVVRVAEGLRCGTIKSVNVDARSSATLPLRVSALAL